ncbi:MAG: 4-hydroxy-3-methylbut-2-enyl diphosphate reductase [Alphaproteobacteria bacterium MarineAlpha5_Bin6]|nr:MAG: 4-hydroxy-3-methylbut-2-enyl diphosphate reductase [Alphaproteobacteria bacterium MarineAlpha5_Bin6]|tara:strand:+ start:5394 stop:6344 length:951 start_codon:yes stop_codon:yes gene_type:complete
MQKKNELDIYLAGPRGFCAGVDRAILMVEEALKKYGKPVYVRHEIVHNKYVVEDLKSKGAIFIDHLDEIKDRNRPVIFSAHGVPKSVPQAAQQLKLLYFDATCPLVSKIHREVENFERDNLPIILIGHRNHPEVVGTMGQIKSKIYLVEKEGDVDSLTIPTNEKIAYVTQTTLSVDDTKSIIKKLKSKYQNIIEPKKNDICYATTNRQYAVKQIASKCDLFVVIGANNSSNSLRLVEVAKQYGANKSKLIESIDSFNLSEIENIKILGITASASAPEILVQNFIKKIEEKFFVNLHKPDYKKEDVNFKIPQQLKVD